MAYSNPPLVVLIQPLAVVITTTVNILAAPGANLRYRVVGVVFGMGRSTTGISDMSILDDTAGNAMAVARGLSVAGTADLDVSIPEPGLVQAVANKPLVFQHSTTVAAGNLSVIVYYYIDQVS
jgi:hypothetical protein